MPPTAVRTSEAAAATAPDYAAALAGFRAGQVRGQGVEAVVSAYHAVRNLPYFSGPDRTPLTALRDRRGACTAKHLILRDLLRDLGETAEVELVEGDFASGVPVAPDMPEELKALIREGGVRDVHCRVRWDGPDGPQRLDATWPDALARWGFAGDAGWHGKGDTSQAIRDITVLPCQGDVLAEKARLLAGLTAEEAERRRSFLRLLSEWLQERS